LRLLLDTHALIWALEAPRRIPAWLRAAVEDPGNEVFASAASAWEIAIKQSLGKLPLPRADFLETLHRSGLVELPITARHAEGTRSLPLLHRDPFDRMLVAQAQIEGLAVVSRDPAIRQYQVTVLWEPGVQALRAGYRVKRKPRRRR
jgi:PIN domain nuclease of toxin-antitoxin system